MTTFSNSGPRLQEADLRALERLVGRQLPQELRDYYLHTNGGTPDPDWFPASAKWDAIWVQEFLKVEPDGAHMGSSEATLQSTYSTLVAKDVLARDMLPVAIDPGGNVFCVDLETGAVSYHVNDVWDASKSPGENQAKAKRALTSSFAEFVASLVSEDEAFS